MQGSNANAVIASPANAGSPVAPAAQNALCWRRKRHWVLPEVYALLQTAGIGGTGCLMYSTDAAGLRFGFFKDHQARRTLSTCSLCACKCECIHYYVLLACAYESLAHRL